MALFMLIAGGLGLFWGGFVLVTTGLRVAVREAVRISPRRLGAVGRRLSRLCAGVLVAACLLAAGLLGNPIYGLAVLLLVPFALPQLVRFWAGRQTSALDSSAIAYFHALRGLVRAGLGLPYALFQLSEAVPSSFAEALRPFLDRFENGRSLGECLERFRGRMELPLTGICLSVLQLAYREGLPVAPFLERMLPLLESDREGRERERSLRHSVAAQAAVAFATPWFLLGALALFQPTLASHCWSGKALVVAAGALAMEAAGVWVLWQVSTFS